MIHEHEPRTRVVAKITQTATKGRAQKRLPLPPPLTKTMYATARTPGPHANGVRVPTIWRDRHPRASARLLRQILSVHISIPESIRAHIRTLGGTSVDLAKALAGRTASIPQPLSFSRPDYDATPGPRNDPRFGCVLAGSKGLCSNADDSRIHSQPKQDDLVGRDHRCNSPRSMLAGWGCRFLLDEHPSARIRFQPQITRASIHTRVIPCSKPLRPYRWGFTSAGWPRRSRVEPCPSREPLGLS